LEGEGVGKGRGKERGGRGGKANPLNKNSVYGLD